MNQMTERLLTGLTSKNEMRFREGAESFTTMEAESALQRLRHNLRESHRKGDRRETAHALLNIAVVLRGQRQYHEALKILEEVKKTYESLEDHAGLASTFLELSFANRELQRNVLALQYANQAAQLFQQLGRTVELGWTYDNLSVIHWNLFQRPESLTYAKKARAIFIETNTQTPLAWNACHLSILYCEMGFYPRAERHALEGMELFTQLKNKQGIAWALFWLGMVNRVQCRFDAASDAIAKARKIFESLKIKDRLGWCLINEAAIKRSIGKGEEAALINRRAMQLFGPLRNHDGVAWSLFQMGQLLRDRGQYLKAWQTFREALNFYTDIANRKGMGWTENDWGETYLELNDLAHARECFVKAKVIADQVDESHLKVGVDKNLALLYLDQGLLQKAENLLEECEAVCEKMKAKELEAEVLLARARQFILAADVKRAGLCVSRVQDLIDKYNLQRLKTSVGLYSAELLAAERKPEKALQVLYETFELAQHLQHRRHAADAMLGMAQLLLQKGSSNIYSMLDQLEKDVRMFSSRKMKAKSLILRGLVSFAKEKNFDPKYFAQSLKILEACGLTPLYYQTLELMVDLYDKIGDEEEKKEYHEEIKRLMARSPMDLTLVKPRRETFKELPISIVS